MDGIAKEGGEGAARSGSFIELDGAQLLASREAAGAVMELSGVDGWTLLIRLPGDEAVDVVSLAEAFWRRGA